MGGVNFSKLYTSFTKPTLLHLNMLQLFEMAALYRVLKNFDKYIYLQLELLQVFLLLRPGTHCTSKLAGKL